jgi:two-component system chemotaxis sensor kinase CheA
MSDEFLDRFLSEYYAECEEHLAAIRRALLDLDDSVGRSQPDGPLMEELFRSFHSIKGIAAMVEHREAELLAHEMESYLRVLRDGRVRLTTAGVGGLIEGTRLLEQSLAAHRTSQPQPDSTQAVSVLRALADDPDHASIAAPSPRPVPAEAWKCLFTPSPELLARGINVDAVRSRLREHGDIFRAHPLIGDGGAITFEFLFSGAPDEATRAAWLADGMVCALADVPVEAATDTAAVRSKDDAGVLSSGHYVRVDLARLDDLMRMIGDLVIKRARLIEALAPLEAQIPASAWRPLQETAAGIERHLRDLREGVMRVRLVPVGEVFRRMPFVVRDLARDTGKRVRVDMTGQETQIDKFLVERMMDPTLHLVRNAMAHGLESADERTAAGKSPEGTLSLSAAAAGEIATIEIADDGRGIDAERVVARARALGLPVPSVIDGAALLDLICSPGFSTRDESDRASGRGFGMSVVRRTVEELGGTLQLWTEPGQGTKFTIELPLTLAITDALLARIGTQLFAVPQASVREVVELDESSVRRLEGAEVAPYRGIALPLLRLSTLLGIEPGGGQRLHAFVFGHGAAAVGLVVDRIVGQREIVVRSVVDPLIRVKGVAGATDLGDGRVVLILDAAAVARGLWQRDAGGAQLARA